MPRHIPIKPVAAFLLPRFKLTHGFGISDGWQHSLISCQFLYQDIHLLVLFSKEIPIDNGWFIHFI